MNFDVTAYSLEHSNIESNLDFKTVCYNEKGCHKYTMLEVFETLSSKVYFDFTIEGNSNYDCSTGASVSIYLWGLKFNDIRYESLKLNQ